MLNTWEAVYHKHDLEELGRLATVASSVGVERFVLDDGWFRGRNDDSSSLGDWYVDEAKYPNGLGALIDQVTGLGMDFGLWVEPESINPDSDLYRKHPEWALGVEGHPLILARNQLVLDLGRSEVLAYLLERLDWLLSEFAISFLKWDMNRDLVSAGGRHGAASVHAQTLAVYELLDELRRRHPAVEIESCSSGGARVDLGIAERTDRFWTSDCNDALERQHIQRSFSYLLPPELMGAHVGPPRSHTTGRTHTLAFRALTSLFGHLGFEWDIATATEDDRVAIAEIIAVYRHFRPLLHGGRVVRVDHPDASAYVHGVVASDRSEALYSYVQLTSTAKSTPLPVRLQGLEPTRRYQVRRILLPGADVNPGRRQPSWFDEGLIASGALLSQVGIPMRVHLPESGTLVHVTTA